MKILIVLTSHDKLGDTGGGRRMGAALAQGRRDVGDLAARAGARPRPEERNRGGA